MLRTAPNDFTTPSGASFFLSRDTPADQVRHNSPNRELVALGAANVAASFVSGTLPGYGSITRSRLAGDTGATTQMTSLLTGGFVLFVTFFLLGFLFYLPKCILAVIICVVGEFRFARIPVAVANAAWTYSLLDSR